MTKKIKRLRQTTRPIASDPYKNLAADIIINALAIATRQAAGDYYDRYLAVLFLQSEKCHRWAGIVGVDLDWALAHEDSLIKLEDSNAD